jgi:hypothetical protein
MLPCGHPRLTPGPCPLCRHRSAVALKARPAAAPAAAKAKPCGGCGKGVKAPGLLQKAANLGRALVRHAVNLGRMVSDADYRRRLDACAGCEHRVGSGRSPACRVCGCAVKLKARMASESCPHPAGDRWALPVVPPAA